MNEQKTRRKCLGIQIDNAQCYDYELEKRVPLVNKFVPSDDIIDQIGHIRFNLEGKRYGLTFKDNLRKYHWIYSS